MQLNNVRVTHKLWATFLGVVLLLGLLAGIALNRYAVLTESAMTQVLEYEDRITKAVRWGVVA